jgi:hypothetical protein
MRSTPLNTYRRLASRALVVLAGLLLGLSAQALRPAAAFAYRLDVTEERECESERFESDLFRRRCRCLVRDPLPPDPSPRVDRSRSRLATEVDRSVQFPSFPSRVGVGAGIRLRC